MMSRVLMIASNIFAYPYPVYPLGMSIVSAALSEKGHSVRQFDFLEQNGSEESLRETIKEFSPDYIGISIRNIDDVDSLSEDSGFLDTEKHIIQIIKENTNAPVIAGGSAFSIMPEEILDYIQADYGIIGEGEKQIIDLIDNLEKGNPSGQILRCRLHPLESSELISPLWDRNLVDFYLNKSSILNIQTKRGCPYNCSYCVYPSLEGKRFRFREPEAIIDDLERGVKIFNADTFWFTDSVFNDPGGYYLEVAEKIITSGLKIRWAGYFRPGGIGPGELSILKRSGLYAVEVGSDAGCDETLDRMDKGFSFSDILEFYDACRSAGISSAYFFIFGGPGESDMTLEEGLNNIRKLEEGVIFIYSGIRILPGAGLYEQAVRENILSKDGKLLEPVYYFSRDINVNDMNDRIMQEAKNNRRYIFPPEKGMMMVDAMHAFGRKGLLWDELLAFSKVSRGRRKKK